MKEWHLFALGWSSVPCSPQYDPVYWLSVQKKNTRYDPDYSLGVHLKTVCMSVHCVNYTSGCVESSVRPLCEIYFWLYRIVCPSIVWIINMYHFSICNRVVCWLSVIEATFYFVDTQVSEHWFIGCLRSDDTLVKSCKAASLLKTNFVQEVEEIRPFYSFKRRIFFASALLIFMLNFTTSFSSDG